MNIIFLDTSLRQISHLGMDPAHRWHPVLESGRWGRSRCRLGCWSTASSLATSYLFIFISAYSLFFSFFWITGPVSLFSSSYQSSISISLTHFSSTPLIFSFIFPPCLQLSSTEPLTGCWRLSELVTRTWSQHLKKKSLIRSSFSLTGLVLIYRFFFSNSLISATSCRQTSDL